MFNEPGSRWKTLDQGGFCPSCAAKRGALFGAFLREEVAEDVGHCLWTFTVPKLLRPYFLHRRELLGELCRAAWESVRELLAEGYRHKRATLGRG